MKESCHLVPLDKPFSQRFPLFIVRLSILSHSPSMVSWVQNKNLSYTFALIFSGFYFSLSSFPSWAWSSSTYVHFHLHGLHHHALHLDCTNLAHFTTYDKVCARFHQLSKTKLGLSESQPLVRTTRTPSLFCSSIMVIGRLLCHIWILSHAPMCAIPKLWCSPLRCHLKWGYALKISTIP